MIIHLEVEVIVYLIRKTNFSFSVTPPSGVIENKTFVSLFYCKAGSSESHQAGLNLNAF